MEITKEMIDAALSATDFANGPISRKWMKKALAAALLSDSLKADKYFYLKAKEAEARAGAAEKRCEELEAALKPFIAAAGMLPATYGPDCEPIPEDETVSVQCCGFYLGDITVADLNRIYELSDRATLSNKEGEANGVSS